MKGFNVFFGILILVLMIAFLINQLTTRDLFFAVTTGVWMIVDVQLFIWKDKGGN